MSTYSAHKGGSRAYVGLDPAHAHATHVLQIVAGHPQPEGVGVEEDVVAGHPEPEGAGEVGGHCHPELEEVGGHHRPELEGVGVHFHPEGEVVAGHLLVLGHLFPI